MKKIFLVILSALLFVACKESKPVKTETRMYELTFVDGKTEIYTIKNVARKTFNTIDEAREYVGEPCDEYLFY